MLLTVCLVTVLRLRGCASAWKAFLICLSVNMWMGIRDVFSWQGLKWLEYILGFYFDLHQWGMEWSLLGLSPSKPLRTHQSSAPVQRWDATTLIYYSGVIHRLWIKRQLNYVVGTAKAGPEQFGTDDLNEPRWRDKRERQIQRDVWSFWLLQATSCFSSMCRGKTEMGVLFAIKTADTPWNIYKKLKVTCET